MVMISGGGGNYSGGGYRHNQNNNNNNNGGDAIAGFAFLGGIGCAGWSVVTLASVGSLALAAMITLPVLIAFACFMESEAKTFKGKGLALGALTLGVLGALLIAPICFVYHIAPFPVWTWASEALYVLALASGVWGQLKGALKFLSLFSAAAVAVALVVLPAPSGAEKAGEDERTWSIDVSVQNAKQEPVDKAWAQCRSVMQWEKNQPFKMRDGFGALTDDKGAASFKFNDDTRLKVAICGATKPATDDAPGYKLSTALVLAPFRGGAYPVTIILTENTDKRFSANPAPASATTTSSDQPTTAAPAAYDESLLAPDLAEAVRAARAAAAAAQDSANLADSNEARAQETAGAARDARSTAIQFATMITEGVHRYENNGYSYAGEWNGTRNGYGIEEWSAPSSDSGWKYSGGFANGDRDGYGVATFSEQDRGAYGLDRYEGQWAQDKRGGFGVLYWLDGETYAGAFADGKRSGAGVSHYADGSSYRGDYSGGDKNGYGMVAFASGDRFAGQYSNGAWNGAGIYDFASGARYEGQWAGNKRDGQGVEWSADGKPARAGRWQAGDFTGAQ